MGGVHIVLTGVFVCLRKARLAIMLLHGVCCQTTLTRKKRLYLACRHCRRPVHAQSAWSVTVGTTTDKREMFLLHWPAFNFLSAPSTHFFVCKMENSKVGRGKGGRVGGYGAPDENSMYKKVPSLTDDTKWLARTHRLNPGTRRLWVPKFHERM